nr:ORF1 [Red fox Torque teno virus 2]
MAPYRRYYRRRYRKPRRRFGRRLRRRRYLGRRFKVRRRRRRFRGFRKRQYITPVMTWMPKHRKVCVIRGWTIAITGTQTTLASRSSDTMSSPSTGNYWFISGLGAANILTVSLRWLYWEWKHWRNTWSTSNQGYDLARYFGTTVTVYPHPNIDILVWWDTEYQNYTIDDYRNIQPGIGLLQRQHKVIRSIKHKGKPRRIKLRPPSTQDTNWYITQQWCNVGLARIGFTILNFNKPFLHTQQGAWGFTIGQTFDNNTNPLQTPTTLPTKFETRKAVKYRWDMDTGEGNQIWIYNSSNLTDGLSAIVTNNMPYYIWFYGWKYKDYQTLGAKQTPGITYNSRHGMLIWWYNYNGEDGYDWTQKNAKQWVQLTTKQDNNATPIDTQASFRGNSKHATPSYHGTLQRYTKRLKLLIRMDRWGHEYKHQRSPYIQVFLAVGRTNNTLRNRRGQPMQSRTSKIIY